MRYRLWSILGCSVFCSCMVLAGPQESEPESLMEAVTEGKVDVNLRLRTEIVEQDGLDGAQAHTARLRLGYGSQAYYGFSFYADVETLESANYGLYNAGPPGGTSLNNRPTRAIVADPEDSELNQGYIKYEYDMHQVIGGRQRIILDDARFVGNVGWRQLEQTFDAVTYKANIQDTVQLQYSYLTHIRRIFGPSSDLDFKSDSHLINVSSPCPVIGKLTAFAYLLDFKNSAANSSNTFGIRYAGNFDVAEDLSLNPTASYARQVDAGTNTTNYQADYLLAEANVTKKGLGSVGAGYELLSSDNGMMAFRTPLATLHGKNGWADAFLTTPALGLQDVYAFVGASLPLDTQGKLYYHQFYADQGGADYGHELDAVVSKAFTKHLKGLVKLAYFDGKTVGGTNYVDRTKIWLQGELTF